MGKAWLPTTCGWGRKWRISVWLWDRCSCQLREEIMPSSLRKTGPRRQAGCEGLARFTRGGHFNKQTQTAKGGPDRGGSAWAPGPTSWDHYKDLAWWPNPVGVHVRTSAAEAMRPPGAGGQRRPAPSAGREGQAGRPTGRVRPTPFRQWVSGSCSLQRRTTPRRSACPAASGSSPSSPGGCALRAHTHGADPLKGHAGGAPELFVTSIL